MTIAACYFSSEGIVFGADSTTTMFVPGPNLDQSGSERHFDYGQKIFEIGEQSSLAITMWGLGGLPSTSFRTMAARFGDKISQMPLPDVEELATMWSCDFWMVYSTDYKHILDRTHELKQKNNPSPEEISELSYYLQSMSGGFCLGGYTKPSRTPQAYEFSYRPDGNDAPNPQALKLGDSRFWGSPNIISRILYGVDFGLLEAIEQSGKWQGSTDDLIQLVLPFGLGQPFDLPIREAIDWVYTSIYATSQSMKFSHLAPVCGGPVEIAVITTDRKFRWVKHKTLDAAIHQ